MILNNESLTSFLPENVWQNRIDSLRLKDHVEPIQKKKSVYKPGGHDKYNQK